MMSEILHTWKTRSILFAFLVVLGLSTSPTQGFAQEWARKMFDVTDHNFGVVARDAKTEYRFKIHNLYVEDVHIASVSSTCGCTTPWIEKPLLKTHEEGYIVAHFNSDRFLGQKGATLTVRIDKPYPAEVRLHVSGYIRSDVVFQPGSVEIGTLKTGEDAERTVDLTYHGGSRWQVTGVTSANPHITAEAVPVTSPYGGRTSYQIKVKVDGDIPPGYIHEQILVETNDYDRRQIPLLVEGVVQAPLVVSPSPLRLGVIESGEQVTKQIVVRGDKPFRIKSIKSQDERFEFGTVSDKVSPIHVIPVTFTADTTSGKIQDRIEIETDFDTGETVASVIVTPGETAAEM